MRAFVASRAQANQVRQFVGLQIAVILSGDVAESIEVNLVMNVDTPFVCWIGLALAMIALQRQLALHIPVGAPVASTVSTFPLGMIGFAVLAAIARTLPELARCVSAGLTQREWFKAGPLQNFLPQAEALGNRAVVVLSKYPIFLVARRVLQLIGDGAHIGQQNFVWRAVVSRAPLKGSSMFRILTAALPRIGTDARTKLAMVAGPVEEMLTALLASDVYGHTSRIALLLVGSND